MGSRLLLLLTLVPFVELYLLYTIGGVIGFWPTVGLVIVTAILGAAFAKREGLRVVQAWQTALAEGRVPEEGVASGLLVVVAGALLIAPGPMTDVLGLLLMITPVRKRVAERVEAYARKHIEASAARGGAPGGMPGVFTFRVGGMPGMGGRPGGFGGARRVRVPVDVIDATGVVVEEHRPDAPSRALPADVIEGEIVDE